MNVILLGYRGSGKTSIGRKIAEATWREFVDTDALVMESFGGRAIADIWATDGEPAFRQREVEVTRQVLGRTNHVIALGGGTVMQPEARTLVRDADDCKRIYLRCSAEVLAKRIADDTDTAGMRPHLTGLGGGVEEIRHVLAAREPVYQEVADATFEVTHVNVEEAVGYLLRQYL